MNSISTVRIVIGGDRSLDEAIGLAGRARRSLSGEFFKLNDPASCAALVDAWQVRGIPGSAVVSAHPQSLEQIMALTGPGTTVAHYADLAPSLAPRQYIHSKSLARDIHTDDPEAWLSTAAMGGDARREWEVSGLFGGDAARSVHELADSVASRDWQRQRDAIAWARSLGVHVIDPVLEARGLSDAVTELTRTEPKRLTVVMKSIFDERYAREIARRRIEDGVPIEVVVGRIDVDSERVLREGGVPLLLPSDGALALHGNVVLAEGLGQAYWGTLWASPRSFPREGVPNPWTGGGDTLPRSMQWDRSRELGAVTSDPQALLDLRAGIALLDARPHDFRGQVYRVRREAA